VYLERIQSRSNLGETRLSEIQSGARWANMREALGKQSATSDSMRWRRPPARHLFLPSYTPHKNLLFIPRSDNQTTSQFLVFRNLSGYPETFHHGARAACCGSCLLSKSCGQRKRAILAIGATRKFRRSQISRMIRLRRSTGRGLVICMKCEFRSSGEYL
jgi:hypothetical protein